MEGKRLLGQLLREIPEITHVKELGAGYEKQTELEALICAGQEQALSTNYVKYQGYVARKVSV